MQDIFYVKDLLFLQFEARRLTQKKKIKKKDWDSEQEQRLYKYVNEVSNKLFSSNINRRQYGMKLPSRCLQIQMVSSSGKASTAVSTGSTIQTPPRQGTSSLTQRKVDNLIGYLLDRECELRRQEMVPMCNPTKAYLAFRKKPLQLSLGKAT